MDTSGSKLQQKALQQPKQKKSKSAEFLMGGMEESAVVEGIENPVFDGSYSTELSASQASAGREIQRDRQDSTLAAHQQKMELRAPAKPRVSTGNERARNYFDPALVQETNPRRCGMAEVGTEDELELKIMNQDEKGLYQKMAEMLDADDDITIIELPGMALAHREEEEVWKVRAGDPTLRVDAGATGRGRFMAAVEEGEEEVIPRYAQQLRERMLPDMITLGSLSLEQDTHLQREGMSQENEWVRKKRLMSFLRGNAKEPQAQSHRDCDQQERILQDRLYAAFQRAESQLLKALRERKGEVIAKYGEMTEASAAAESPWAREPGLGWQVEWSQSPQPMEVRVRCLRAVRDKLPRGLYSLSVALHSRLGGPALTWSCLKEEQWAGTTEPVEHGGHFYDTELYVNQSLFTILPASCDMLPSMVLLFRLLGLTGERSQVGTTLGWAAFPVCHATLTTVQGRFKTPILRGLPHPHLDQFRKIEGLMSADLDNWLCNLYFQVRKLPSGSSRGDVEHSVSLQIPPLLVPPSPPQAGPSGTSPSRGRGGIKPCHRGSPLHLSASHSSSACSSSTLPGKNSTVVVPEKIEEMRDPYTEKAETWMHYKKKPINKINSSSAHVRGSAAPPPLLQGQADKQETAAPAAASSEKRENLWAKEMEEYTFSLQFQFHAHTVELVYQNSLLHTREELAMVVVGPLTLNAVTLLLLLIRWGCQLAFGSLPSFTSNFIMALGVWTVLDPLAVFVVDAVLGRLSYSAESPVADAAKLYWHFYRTDQSGAAGVVITLFLYAILFLLSITILYLYFLRLHNEGRMLDIFQRLSVTEGSFFVPRDLEVSNRELDYIIQKAEQWRGFNGERRKHCSINYGGCLTRPAQLSGVRRPFL